MKLAESMGLHRDPIPLIPTIVSKHKQQALELTSSINRVKRRLVAQNKKTTSNENNLASEASTSGTSNKLAEKTKKKCWEK